ncbi:hypothetical protein ABG067_001049 [Albugo candida]
MFKLHVRSGDLLLEDCRGNPCSVTTTSTSSSPAEYPSFLRLFCSNGSNASPHDECDIETMTSEAGAALLESKTGSVQRTTTCFAFYGMYKLLSGMYLAYIKDARVIGSGPRSEKIYCILSLKLIPISQTSYQTFLKNASSRDIRDEGIYISMIESVFLARTFYFSYEYDLTLSAQRKAIKNSMSSVRNTTIQVPAHMPNASLLSPVSSSSGAGSQTNGSKSSTSSTSSVSTVNQCLWQHLEDDFFWNRRLIQPFLVKELHSWIIPVINGFVKVIKKCEGLRCDLFLFTRRSWRRTGTRFNVRGVDKEGNVANFVETEMMIVKPNDSICSYVQIRGSIPLYWDQLVTLKYMPRTRYAYSTGSDRIVDWNGLAFRAHMDNIIQRYGHITVVNLVDRAGSSRAVRDQAQLGTTFGKYVKKYNQQSSSADNGSENNSSNSSPRTGITAKANANSNNSALSYPQRIFADPIQYVWFDFHHECRKMQWQNLSKLVNDVKDQFEQYGWFECDKSGRILQRQKGVFRINCMDNLDRTNVVMSLFARRTTLMALNLLDSTKENVLESPYRSFEVVFKNAWADNADYISKMYAGTGALKTDFTRTGKRTIMGALQDGVNSITRYYLNNFVDGIRQDSYDLIVANYVPDKREESPFTFQQRHSFLVFLCELGVIPFMAIIISVSAQSNLPIRTHLYHSFIMTLCTCVTIGYLIVKKGMFRSLGRRYVCKPAFCSSGYIKRRE